MKPIITFDLDGTIADSCASVAKCINYTLKHENKSEIDHSKIIPLVGIGLQNILEKLKIEISFELYNYFFETKFIDEIVLYKDSIYALRAAESLGFTTALVTNRSQDLAIKIARKLDIPISENHIFGIKEGVNPKPATDLFRLAENSINGSILFHVGDHLADVKAAKNYKISSALVRRNDINTDFDADISNCDLEKIVNLINNQIKEKTKETI